MGDNLARLSGFAADFIDFGTMPTRKCLAYKVVAFADGVKVAVVKTLPLVPCAADNEVSVMFLRATTRKKDGKQHRYFRKITATQGAQATAV